MKIKELAEENYYRFCQFEGCDYIATEYALYRILQIISKFKVSSVLEVGLGIGCIADTVLKYQKGPNFYYAGTEANTFCKTALRRNVESYNKIDLYESIEEVPDSYTFDLIIVDGQDGTLQELPKFCTKRSLIFIEGDRSPQADLILSLFPKAKQVQLISIQKNKDYSTGNPNFFVGGGRLIFTNPDLFMKTYRFKEKVSTYIKRYIRTYI